MPAKYYKATEYSPPYPSYDDRIFLAGSIEMGTAVQWQAKVEESLKDTNVIVFNPRRDDWDSSWEQSINNVQFSHQVNWELDKINESNIIFFYFDPNTKSPITLMELGYVAALEDKYVIVCCPPGFWRKGNVDILCARAGIVVYDHLDAAIVALRKEVCF